MTKKVTIFEMEDWESLYVDGDHIDDHHHVLEKWMEEELKSLGYEFETIYLENGNYMGYDFPNRVEDVLLDSGDTSGEEAENQSLRFGQGSS